MDYISTRIKHLRRIKEMSLSQFGESIGYSKTYISYLEADERPITDKVAEKIIKTHSVRKEWLVFGKGDIYDKEKAALNEIYQKLLKTVRRYPLDCKRFRDFLIIGSFEKIDEIKSNCNKLSIFDYFSDLSLKKIYNSDIEPRELIQSLITLYSDIENALKAWIKSVKILKDPAQGLAEFYMENENEKAMIDKIETELIDCRALVSGNRSILEKNTDNNSLLEILELYKLFHKSLDYKENIELIELMREKMNKPPD